MNYLNKLCIKELDKKIANKLVKSNWLKIYKAENPKKNTTYYIDDFSFIYYSKS